MFNATQSYRQAQVNTVGRADITLMLYDGLLRFLDLAATAMEKKQIQEKGNYISRALDIINELDSTLNMEKGGEVAKGLHNLYLITNKNLLMANLKNDLVILKSARENMQVIRDSFFEAMQTEEAKQMLSQMGPVPMASSGTAQVSFGGSIQERANQIKESQQKVIAIQKAKAQFENAKTDEEKALAKKELEALLGKNILAQNNTKPVPTSMAQKANRAFMQQQGFSRPLSAFSAPSSALSGQSAGQGTGQALQNVSRPMPQMANSYLKQANPVMAPVSSEPVQSTTVTAKMAQLNEKLVKTEQDNDGQQTGQQNTQQKSPLSQMGTMSQMGGGLLNRKMALYKNL